MTGISAIKRGRGRPAKATASSSSVSDSDSKKLQKRSRARQSKAMRKPLSTYSFSRFIHRVMKEIHPELRISKQSMSIVNSFVLDTFERVAKEASNVHRRSKTRTMSSRDIQFAVKLLIPGELGEHAMAEGAKAVMKYTKSYES